MLNIYLAETAQDMVNVRELFLEYLNSAKAEAGDNAGASSDAGSRSRHELVELAELFAPEVRLLLAEYGCLVAGLAVMRRIGEGVAVVNKMYVRPVFRQRGIRQALIDRLVEEARKMGYPRLCLDTARDEPEALPLYKSAGFRAVESHAQTEIPQLQQSRWICLNMES